ncbi:MAG: hypothetical protein Q9206_004873 [Seirophora lacunosa]
MPNLSPSPASASASASASSGTATSTSTPRSTRRRGLSYLRSSTIHRLSSLSPSNDSSSPAARPLPPEASHPVAAAPSPPTGSLNANRSSDPADEPLLPPNPLHSPSSSAQFAHSVPGDGAAASVVNTAIGGISRIMARHRLTRSTSETSPSTERLERNGPAHELPSIRLVPHQDPRSNRPSLVFPPMARTLPSEDSVIRVGRYSERDTAPNPPPNIPSATPVGFKSKVVSRKHCEFWCANGQWFIKDVKSSSGTFLNHIRLSQPSVESRPFPVKDGDVVQLGIDFRGGEEMIFRCVKIRVECNRGWQKALNTFNVATHKRLMGKPIPKDTTDPASAHSSECAICLMSIAVPPCSHVWHYKCIRPILNDHKTFPSFLCPNCRAVTDLEADVDDPDAMDDWEDEEASSGSVADEKNASSASEISREAAQQEIEHEDDDLAGMTSRQLSVRNGGDPPTHTIESTGVDAPPPSRSAPTPNTDGGSLSSSLPSLLNRRNARHVTPPRCERLPATAEEQSTAVPLSQDDFLRPITPTQAFLAAGDIFHRDAMMGDAITPGSELGPMTPTNHAGPFVFDGSAGRDSGPRPAVGTASDGSNEVISKA